MIRFIVLFLFSLQLTISFSQTSGNYAFSQINTASLSSDMNGNPVNMVTGSSQIIGPAQDSALSAIQAIGFDFYFMGTCMNTFSCNENGLVELGSRTIAANSSSVSNSVIPNVL